MTVVKILVCENDDRNGTVTNFPICGIHQWVSVLQHMKKKWNFWIGYGKWMLCSGSWWWDLEVLACLIRLVNKLVQSLSIWLLNKWSICHCYL